MHITTAKRGSPGLDFSSGWSDADDPELAGREAVVGALAGRAARSADLVLVFARGDLDPLLVVDAVGRAAAPARVVACSSPAPFSGVAGPARCVATHLPAGRLRFGVGWNDVPTDGLLDATRSAVTAARDAASHHGEHAAVILLADASTGDPKDVVWGAYDVTGATVPLVGGVVGSDSTPRDSWLAADGMILRKGIVAVWVASTSPLGVAFGHGWRPVSRPLQVTRATDSEVLELDGRPAAEVYLDARAAIDPDLLETGPHGFQMPIGVPRDEGGYEVRAFVSTDADGIKLVGHIHEQAIVRLMGARHDHLVEGAGEAVAAAVAQLEEAPRGALVFSCNIRNDLLEGEVGQEIAAIGDALGGAPASGFFTHGEFAKVPGSSGFHNASVAVLAL